MVLQGCFGSRSVVSKPRPIGRFGDLAFEIFHSAANASARIAQSALLEIGSINVQRQKTAAYSH
jgi:hypothetical protein